MSDDPINISGVLPSLHVKADLVPRRSEAGIGALMPWADRLWIITYPSTGTAAQGPGSTR